MLNYLMQPRRVLSFFKREEINREAVFMVEESVKLSPNKPIGFRNIERKDRIQAGARL